MNIEELRKEKKKLDEKLGEEMRRAFNLDPISQSVFNEIENNISKDTFIKQTNAIYENSEMTEEDEFIRDIEIIKKKIRSYRFTLDMIEEKELKEELDVLYCGKLGGLLNKMTSSQQRSVFKKITQNPVRKKLMKDHENFDNMSEKEKAVHLIKIYTIDEQYYKEELGM